MNFGGICSANRFVKPFKYQLWRRESINFCSEGVKRSVINETMILFDYCVAFYYQKIQQIRCYLTTVSLCCIISPESFWSVVQTQIYFYKDNLIWPLCCFWRPENTINQMLFNHCVTLLHLTTWNGMFYLPNPKSFFTVLVLTWQAFESCCLIKEVF